MQGVSGGAAWLMPGFIKSTAGREDAVRDLPSDAIEEDLQ